jgi:hypothetical protein
VTTDQDCYCAPETEVPDMVEIDAAEITGINLASLSTALNDKPLGTVADHEICVGAVPDTHYYYG